MEDSQTKVIFLCVFRSLRKYCKSFQQSLEGILKLPSFFNWGISFTISGGFYSLYRMDLNLWSL